MGRAARSAAAVLAVGLGSVLPASPARAQGQAGAEGPEAPPPVGEKKAETGMPELITGCAGADEFGGTELERAAWCHLQQNGYVAARTLADKALTADESSFRAHYLMGAAQHLGEGNLPKSLYHLERAERLFVDAYGRTPPEDAPQAGYRRTLLELVYVHGEMDHHEAKIDYVDAISSRLGLDYSPLKAWPLLKLKRFDEAEVVARQAIASHDGPSFWRAVGLTALCAIESEQRHRQAAYEACQAAAEPALRGGEDGGVALSNAAASAMEVFKFDEAERLYLESTRRPVEGTINPWGRLAHLYLRQGRFPEALSALRSMHAYRNARPPYFDQQDQADAELTGAALLFVAGRMEDALRVTSRVAERPDRQGTSSAASEQMEAGNLIMDRVARLDVARRRWEEASWSPWRERPALWWAAARLGFDAWLRGRQINRLLADSERLVSSLRPECPGSVEVPAWLDGEVVQVVGPGVTLAGVAQAREEETLEPAFAGPVFAAFEAEAYWLDGDLESAFERAGIAAEQLPAVEVLLRARAQAIAADAAWRLGRVGPALAHFEAVLQADPGVLRRLGIRLPVSVVGSGSRAGVTAAVDHLDGSPRFERADGGFLLRLSEAEVGLASPDGSELLTARVGKGPADDEAALGRRIARAAHFELLVPKVDVTQADVRSLDGGLTGGGRASERARSILDSILGDDNSEE